MHKGELLACTGPFRGLPSSAAEHEKSLKECVRATLGLQSSIGLGSFPGVDGMASRLGLPWRQVLSVLVIAVSNKCSYATEAELCRTRMAPAFGFFAQASRGSRTLHATCRLRVKIFPRV